MKRSSIPMAITYSELHLQLSYLHLPLEGVYFGYIYIEQPYKVLYVRVVHVGICHYKIEIFDKKSGDLLNTFFSCGTDNLASYINSMLGYNLV